MTERSFDVLIDTSAFVAHLMPDDLLHKEAQTAFTLLQTQRLHPVTTNAVVGETISVLSIRIGQDLARRFLSSLEASGMPIIFVDEQMHENALHLFKQQPKKGTSYVDCTDVIVMQKLDIPFILSFDEFHRRMGLKEVGTIKE